MGRARGKPARSKASPRSRSVQLATWLPAAVWAYLLTGRGRYWSTSVHLPPPRGARQGAGGPQGARPEEVWPDVAVVVPARDEALLLPETLPSLLAQDYPGHAWVVLVDDESTDGTASLAREIAAAGNGKGLGLSIVAGTERPPGWAGKPWAMAQGAAAALAAPRPAEWLLFTDADIYHPPSSLRELVAAALEGGRQGVSLMARLSARSGWERLMMPAFVYFFAQIYPFAWVNDVSRPTAAAAGGCMLVEVRALDRAGGVDAVAGRTIDDVALAKALKRSGSDIWLGLAGREGPGRCQVAGAGVDVESRRRYPAFGDVWEMVARNAYTQLGHSPIALAGTVGGLCSIYLAPPVLAVAGLAAKRRGLALAGLAAWSAMTATYLPVVRYYRLPPRAALALPFTAALYTAMTISSAWRYHVGGGAAWKGRGIG